MELETMRVSVKSLVDEKHAAADETSKWRQWYRTQVEDLGAAPPPLDEDASDEAKGPSGEEEKVDMPAHYLDPSRFGEDFWEKVERAKAADRSYLSATSECPPDLLGERIRKEAGEVNIPHKLPTVPTLAQWKVTVASALVQASAFGDRAEVAWFRECGDAGKSTSRTPVTRDSEVSTTNLPSHSQPLRTRTPVLSASLTAKLVICLRGIYFPQGGSYDFSYSTSSKRTVLWALGSASTI
jgi:hypothetical protein